MSAKKQRKPTKNAKEKKKENGTEYNTHVGRSRHPSPRTRASLERMSLCYLHPLQPLP